MLALALDCQTRLLLRLARMEDAGEPPPGPQLSMLAGTWGHKAAAAFYNGADWRAVMEPYEEITNQQGFPTDRRGYANMVAVCDAVFSRLYVDRLPFEVIKGKSELTFTAPLGTLEDRDGEVDVVLIGVFDHLVRDKKTSHKMPLERKFTGKLDAAFIARFTNYDIQTTSYIYAADLTQDTYHGEAYVDAIEMRDVPHSDRTCDKHGTPYAECGPEHVKQVFILVRRTPEELEEFKNDALWICKHHILPAARTLEREGVEAATHTRRAGRFTMTCDNCEYSRWCLVNKRSPRLMKTMLREQAPDDRLLRSGLLPVEVSDKLAEVTRELAEVKRGNIQQTAHSGDDKTTETVLQRRQRGEKNAPQRARRNGNLRQKSK